MNANLKTAAKALMSAAVLVGVLSGCATTNTADPRDPLEGLNRATFQFNDTLDKYALEPIAHGYTIVVPQPVRSCIGGVFGNFSDAWTAVNNMLEGNAHDAGSDVNRVAVNSTVGLLGCFDIASGMGLEKHHKDFGITLGTWGIGPGYYVVIPLLGPSDVRDTAGLVVDFETDPVGYLYPIWQRNTITGVRIIDTRSQLLGAGNLLEGAALDKYVFVRDGYYTRRRSQVYNGNPPDEEDDTSPNPLQTPQKPAPAANSVPQKTSQLETIAPH
jgi:phospholipid-binding lipoprotein MlaA